MDRRQTTKTVVHHLNNFAISSATAGIIRNYTRRSENPVIDLAINVSIFVASWNAASVIMEPIDAKTNEGIDKFFDAIEKPKPVSPIEAE